MADILCFTGHKALFGPQGTGGIIVNRQLDFKLVKTGGSGTNSFGACQGMEMPEIFEAGTHNAHGLAGLQRGVEYINNKGLSAIEEITSRLLKAFLDGVKNIQGIIIYGDNNAGSQPRIPIAVINIGSMASGDVALNLWESRQIAVRSGSHCAPLVHKFFKTEAQGMVRFSFSTFNTMEEVAIAVEELKKIAERRS